MKHAPWQIHAPRRSLLGIQVGADRLAVSLARRDGGRPQLVQTIDLPVPLEKVLDDPAAAGRELGRELRAAGIREKRCVICIPPEWALTAPTPLPPVSGDDLTSFLELRAEKEFPLPAAELRIAHSAYLLPNGNRNATLAVVQARRLSAVQKLATEAGCKPVSISLGLEACAQDVGDQGSLNFLLNGKHLHVVVRAGGGIAALRSLPGPAEPSPADSDSTSQTASLSREIRITLGRLAQGLQQTLNECRLFDLGGGNRDLQKILVRPLQQLGIDQVRTSPAGAPAFASAAHILEGRPLLFEFLPPHVSRAQIFLQKLHSRRNRWGITAAVTLGVLMLGTLQIRALNERRLDRHWRQIRPTVTELDALQGNIRLYRPWFDSTPHSIDILAALAEAFPEDDSIWAKTVEIEDNRTVTCRGSAQSQEVLMRVLDRIRANAEVSQVQFQEVRGAQPVTFSFSFLWRAGHED